MAEDTPMSSGENPAPTSNQSEPAGSTASQPQPQPQPQEVLEINRIVDGLTKQLRAENESITQRSTSDPSSSAAASLRAQKGDLLKAFKTALNAVQSRISKAVHEAESTLGPVAQPPAVGGGPGAADRLAPLAGLEPDHELNRMLGRVEIDGKPHYHLRASTAADFGLPPSSFSPPDLVLDGTPEAAAAGVGGGTTPTVVLPTLRNVWVIQHAYARALKHKESVIARYLAEAGAGAVSKKYGREYYEDLSLVNLPSKSRLGNLLDVRAGQTMLYLAMRSPRGEAELVEAVTGGGANMSCCADESTLVVPVTEANIQKLHGVYRALRAKTSEQRHQVRMAGTAESLPDGDFLQLQEQLSSAGLGASSNKRRRTLNDDGADR